MGTCRDSLIFCPGYYRLENTFDSAASNNGLTMLTGSEGQGLGGA